MVPEQAVAHHVTSKGELDDLSGPSRSLPQERHDACLNAIKAGPRLAPAVEHGIAPIAHQTVGKSAVDAACAGRPLVTGRLMWKRAVHGQPPRQCTKVPHGNSRSRALVPASMARSVAWSVARSVARSVAWAGYGLDRSHTHRARWRPRQAGPGPCLVPSSPRV